MILSLLFYECGSCLFGDIFVLLCFIVFLIEIYFVRLIASYFIDLLLL